MWTTAIAVPPQVSENAASETVTGSENVMRMLRVAVDVVGVFAGSEAVTDGAGSAGRPPLEVLRITGFERLEVGGVVAGVLGAADALERVVGVRARRRDARALAARARGEPTMSTTVLPFTMRIAGEAGRTAAEVGEAGRRRSDPRVVPE